MIQKSKIYIGNALIEILMQGGFSEHGTQRYTDLHIHPDYEIHYVEEGEFTFSFADKKVLIGKHNVIIIPPKFYHSVCAESESVKRLSFELRFSEQKSGENLYEKYNSLFSEIKEPIFFPAKCDELSSIVNKMGIIRGTEEHVELNAYFTIAFLKICKMLEGDSNESSTSTPIAEVNFFDTDYTVIHILDLIRRRCCEQIKLEDVEREVNLSARQIQRILSESMGEGFYDLVLKNRMNKAHTVIINDKDKRLSLEEIALSCGFLNYVSFRKAFKKYYGISPSKYRNIY